MKKISLEERKRIMLEILKYIDYICKKYDIPYFVYGGTMIGVVRHHGFIPWDDDIDIALVDDDYNKLLDVLKNEKNDNIYLLDHSIDKDYFYPFAKLVDARTMIIEEGFDTIKNYGVYVDIFKITGCPIGKEKKYLKKIFNNYRLIFYSHYNYTDKNIFIRLLRKRLIWYSKILGIDKILKNNAELMNTTKVDNSNYTTSNWNMSKKLVPSEYYKNIKDKIIRQEFEGVEVNNLKDFDKILRIHYGDYMKLPPKNQRIIHNCEAYWRNK